MFMNIKHKGTAILFAVLFNITAFSQNFSITDYLLQGSLSKDNVMNVTETISVDFYEPSHGLYREIPLFFEAKRTVNGKEKLVYYKTQVKNIDTYDENVSIDSSSDYLTMKLGRADTVFTGNKTYKISYQVIIPDDRIKEDDFIFYSVLGPDWKCSIQNFNFELNLEKPLSRDTKVILYSGSLGKEINTLDVAYSFDSTSIKGAAKNIPPKNAITIFANLPQGYFENPYKTPTFFAWLFAIASVITTLTVLLYGFKSHHKKIVQTVEFYPPKGINSADVGFIIDNSAQDIDVLSLIPLWADQGYLTIEEVNNKKGKLDYLVLNKVKPLEKEAGFAANTLFNALFEKGDRRELKNLDNSFITSLDASKSLLRDKFTGDKRLYKGSGKALGLVFLESIMCGAFIATTSQNGIFANLPLGMFACFILMFFGTIRMQSVYSKNFKKSHLIPTIIFSVVFIGFLSIILLISKESSIIPEQVLFGVSYLAALSMFFSDKLIQMTDYNVEITGKLLGLKEFIKVAELPKLKMLVDENPDYFYNILPYAMVFGLTEKWTKQFKSLNLKNPSWYKTSSITPFDAIYLNRTLYNGIANPVSAVRAAQAAQKAASHAAAGSSHSGGGFSGGGAGGGGGGSW